jgi:hypothetical protein
MSGEVASTTLEVGRRLSGKVGSYKILEQFTKDRDVWKAVYVKLIKLSIPFCSYAR